MVAAAVVLVVEPMVHPLLRGDVVFIALSRLPAEIQNSTPALRERQLRRIFSTNEPQSLGCVKLHRVLGILMRILGSSVPTFVPPEQEFFYDYDLFISFYR